jgi:glycosyltransferase involved in cell wall biosynthesis
MKAFPLVSILITNYNYARYLGKAIDSALNQTFRNIEVVVVDDGSGDNSLEVIKSYGDRIVSVVKQNGGQGSAFNAGFAKSRGEIICFLDSDDEFALDKVEHVSNVFADNSHLGWCWDIERKFDGGTGERLPHHESKIVGKWDARQLMAEGKPPIIPTACSGMSFRRETLARILPMPEPLRITADGYVKLAALAISEGWLDGKELTLQRIHGANLYTGQHSRRRRVAGRTGLLIGIYFKERFPALHRTALHMSTRGLGMCWATGGVDADCKALLHSFLKKLPWHTKLEVGGKAAYWAARGFLHV